MICQFFLKMQYFNAQINFYKINYELSIYEINLHDKFFFQLKIIIMKKYKIVFLIKNDNL